MQRFDDDWQSTDDVIVLDIEDGQEFVVEWSCASPVLLEGLRDDTWVLLRHAAGDCRVRGRFRGFSALRLSANAEMFGYSVRQVVREQGEPLNDLDPPSPPMPQADNLLLQVRNMMRQEIRRSTSEVFEPEDLPFADRYVIDDDDERFEEEIAAETRSDPSQPTEVRSTAGDAEATVADQAAPEARPESSEPPVGSAAA